MLPVRRLLTVGGALIGVTAHAYAQQTPVPIRPLGPNVAVSKEALANIGTIRALSDGHVLVNDKVAHRVVMFDPTLSSFVTVADTTNETAKAYGGRPGGLLAYYGDSSLFVDQVSISMLVIDPQGKINRVISAPTGRGRGLVYLTQPQFGATFDGAGNILSKWPVPKTNTLLALAGGAAGTTTPPPPPTGGPGTDSSMIVRANIATKTVDTVVHLLAVQSPMRISAGPDGAPQFTVVRNPLQTSDDWTVMPDGTIAIVREVDYHIDWLAKDGTITSSPRIQHEWERMTDSMKTALIDSAKRADSIEATKVNAADSSSAGAGQGGGVGRGGGAGIGFGGIPGGGAGAADPTGFAAGLAAGTGGRGGIVIVGPGTIGGGDTRYADIAEIPDYRPPFLPADSLGFGATRVDAEGNLWIRANLSKPPAGGQVFDVVNRQGKLIDRIQIPGATILMGFGPGIAYLISRDGAGYHLAKARIH